MRQGRHNLSRDFPLSQIFRKLFFYFINLGITWAWESYFRTLKNCVVMKSFFLLPLFLLNTTLPGYSPDFIDPTGTYILKGDVKKNRIVGHYGELRVRLLDPETAAFCFYINDGYPNYAFIALMDTLKYEDNRLFYKSKRDTSCSLVLSFNAHDVELMEIYSDPQTGCGYGPGVLIPAIFDKESSEIPIIQDLSRQGQG